MKLEKKNKEIIMKNGVERDYFHQHHLTKNHYFSFQKCNLRKDIL